MQNISIQRTEKNAFFLWHRWRRTKYSAVDLDLSLVLISLPFSCEIVFDWNLSFIVSLSFWNQTLISKKFISLNSSDFIQPKKKKVNKEKGYYGKPQSGFIFSASVENMLWDFAKTKSLTWREKKKKWKSRRSLNVVFTFCQSNIKFHWNTTENTFLFGFYERHSKLLKGMLCARFLFLSLSSTLSIFLIP